MKKVAIIGGDKRNIELAKIFTDEGIPVNTYGIIDESIKELSAKTLEEAITGAGAIITGIPCTQDGETINASEKISYTYLFNIMKEGQIFWGGIIKDNIYELAMKKNIKCKDFMNFEEFAIFNSIPTAEGAVEIALKETEITLHNSNIIITGFGRIGKVLSKILLGFSANVYVAARNEKDIAWIKALGYKALCYKDLREQLKYTDIVFNTVPSMIFDTDELMMLKKGCIIIDLASKPGGINFEKAKELDIKTEWALGLPGKNAPRIVAEYMKELIIK